MDNRGFTGNDSSSNSTTNSDSYLKNLNKISHKISKPTRKLFPLPPTDSYSTIPLPDPNPQLSGQGQAQSQQPPVYNINKNDFRDVVQKLTGSPAHERLPTPPPPATQSRQSSSRLQRIRPPPLVQINNRPPLLNPVAPRPLNDFGSLLPPLPSVHHAAESPISAYMRVLQNSAASSAPIGPRADHPLPQQNDVGVGQQVLTAESPISAYMRFLQNSIYSSSATSPKCNSAARPPPPQPPAAPAQPLQQPNSPFPVMPLSPLPFGCIPSPRSQYGMLSPGLLFSQTGQFGMPQLPLSPTVPLPSPRWKGI